MTNNKQKAEGKYAPMLSDMEIKSKVMLRCALYSPSLPLLQIKLARGSQLSGHYWKQEKEKENWKSIPKARTTQINVCIQ